MRVGIGSDHAGFDLKVFLAAALKKEGYEVVDYGINIKKSVDYPDFAVKLTAGIQAKEIGKGILICGTGIGMSIAANKFKGIRAARCCCIQDACLARQHNDANVITLGGRLLGNDLAFEMVNVFLDTPFLKGRHLKRVNKIKSIDK
ncbi:MAG: ribose 5-phosphate isomerase B [Elusimicrobia bacterium]|jgi:ribose 5-phosphate isomerase B|nr:ribose 5-phosphate isomerase B [Elusimicrobiota bacterium]